MYRQRLLRNIVVTESQILKTTISIYRKRSSDETDSDDENEEESGISNKEDEFFKKKRSSLREIDNNEEESGISNKEDEFFKKKRSSLREIDNNDEDEKEQLVIRIRQVVIEIRVNTKLNNQIIKTEKYRIKLMTSLVKVSVTNVVTLKTVHLDSFFKELIKTRIFI